MNVDTISYAIPPAFYCWPGEWVTSSYHATLGYICEKGNMLLDLLRADKNKHC